MTHFEQKNHSSRLVLHRLGLGLLITIAVACQVEPIEPTPLPTAQPSIGANSPAAGLKTYTSNLAPLRFSYDPERFVVEEAGNLSSDSAVALAAIQIWTREHHQKIQAGDYEGGTEYPANVSVTLQPNPQGLSPNQWAERSGWFPELRNLQETALAGRPAIAFEASGLYESEQVAVATPDGQAIVLVTLNKMNNASTDSPYEAVFQQVLETLTFQ